VDLEFHTPRVCDTTTTDGGAAPDGGVDTCPLGAVRGLRTRIQRVDGTVSHSGCQPVPPDFCGLEDLQDFLFVPMITASEAREIQLTGWTEADCTDLLVLECESLGGGAIELGEVDTAPLFCACPYATDR